MTETFNLTETFDPNVSDRRYIKGLMSNYDNFINHNEVIKIQYPLDPRNTQENRIYNSNSFTHGLLIANSFTHEKPSVNVPGWEHPIPAFWFVGFGGECNCYEKNQ